MALRIRDPQIEDILSASWLQSLAAAVRKGLLSPSRIKPPLHYDESTNTISIVLPDVATFRVTAVGSNGFYAGIEQREKLDTVAWEDLPGGRVATLSGNPADPLKERNGSTAVPIGWFVRAERAADSGLWVFDQDVCPT